MEEIIYLRIKKNIVQKLYSKGCFGKGHLLIIRLTKGTSKEDIPYVKKVLKKLVREEMVLIKKTKHGLCAYLNMNKLKEIEDLIEKES